MKIYVEERDMPKNCMNCPCGAVYFAYSCKAEQKEFEKYPFDGRQDWCPLVPVPPHGDLIEKSIIEKAIEDSCVECEEMCLEFDGLCADCDACVLSLVKKALTDAPTVIPESGMEGEA